MIGDQAAVGHNRSSAQREESPGAVPLARSAHLQRAVGQKRACPARLGQNARWSLNRFVRASFSDAERNGGAGRAVGP